LWIKSKWEWVTTSLFFAPVLAVFFAILLGVVCTYIDTLLSQAEGIDPPVLWTTTISSAQSLLSTVAGATISFAGTAFSVSLLVIQLASTSYSPRVIHTLFRDPFSRRIVSLVVGTFSYCLVVMRSLGDSRSESVSGGGDGTVMIPNISVAVAFILGILSVLAVVAFIDHAAHTMDVSQLLEKITRDTLYHIQLTWEEDDGENDGDESDDGQELGVSSNASMTLKDLSKSDKEYSSDAPDDKKDSDVDINEDNPKKPKSKKGEEAEAEISDNSHVVRFRSSGWVQEIDYDFLQELVPEGGIMKVHTLAGRYAIPGTAVCSVSPKPNVDNWKEITGGDFIDKDTSESQLLEKFDGFVLDAFMVGLSRTIRCDATYGLRQLVDIILRALSPGVNDPTTAQDGIFHSTAVVTEFLHRKIPKSIRTNKRGGKLILNEQQDYDGIVRLAFEEARVCASSSPTVALYLLESLRLIRESLQAGGYPERAPEIERQARLIEECIRNNTSNINDDHDMIARARQDRFDTTSLKGYSKDASMFA
jgi:uncharacterized membrane protein